jgi:two-component system OmpR family response regulator
MTQAAQSRFGRLLVVDDDTDIRDLIVEQLETVGYAPRAADSIASAKAVLASEPIDLIILDLTLPDGDGADFCRALRASDHQAAIIMVTARDAPSARVMGLENGADDYLVKPFEPRELVARVHNLLRRTLATTRQRELRKARFGLWELDLIKRRLTTPDGELVMLSTSEFEILQRFLKRPNEPIDRDELLPERSATVWMDRSTDNLVSRLRHKLASVEGGEGLIVTVRNRGYLLACDVAFS